jgi:hypothetical protein
MQHSLARLIDRVIAWIDRLVGPAPQPIPLRVTAGKRQQPSKR